MENLLLLRKRIVSKELQKKFNHICKETLTRLTWVWVTANEIERQIFVLITYLTQRERHFA